MGTPGGKLTVQYRTKAAKGPSCGDCGISLPGIAHLRPKQYTRIPKCQKTVARAYGGSRCEVALDKEFFVHSLLKNNVKLRPALYKQPEKKLNKSNKLKKAKKPDQKEKEKAKSKCC